MEGDVIVMQDIFVFEQTGIVEGKIQKFYKESALLAQPFVKDPDVTIEQLITEVSAKTGEKIQIARFARFKVGEGA